MTAVQTVDVQELFLFVGDLNGHHQKGLGSTNTNRHGAQYLISQLRLVAISWLSAGPMHVVEFLPIGLLMFLTSYWFSTYR